MSKQQSKGVSPRELSREIQKLYARSRTPDMTSSEEGERQKLLRELQADPSPLLQVPDSLLKKTQGRLIKQGSATYHSNVPLGSKAMPAPMWDDSPRSKFRSSSSFDYSPPPRVGGGRGGESRDGMASPTRFRTDRNSSTVYMGGFREKVATKYEDDFQQWKVPVQKVTRNARPHSQMSQVHIGLAGVEEEETDHFMTSTGMSFASPLIANTQSEVYTVPTRISKNRNASQVPLPKGYNWEEEKEKQRERGRRDKKSRALAKATFKTTSTDFNERVERAVRQGYRSDYAEMNLTYAGKDKLRSDTMISKETPDWFRVPQVHLREKPRTPKITEEEDRVKEELAKLSRRSKLLKSDLARIQHEKKEKIRMYRQMYK